MNRVKIKSFFELGVAFAQFSAQPEQENYENTRKIALALELEFPNYDDLKGNLWWDFVPPAEWFVGSDGGSFRNCYEIGILAYLRFLLALPPRTRTEQISETEQKLKDLFEEENIVPEVLDDYLTDLDTDDPSKVNVSLRTFVQNFPKAFPKKEQIFDNLGPPPSAFDDDVLETLQLTIDEASVCYKHECYLATIVLCGKIIETVLKNAYKVVFGEYPFRPPNKSGKKTEKNFTEIREELTEKRIGIEKALDIQLELIYHHRNAAMHGDIKIPTKEEAKNIAGLTQDAIKRIFQNLNRFVIDQSK